MDEPAPDLSPGLVSRTPARRRVTAGALLVACLALLGSVDAARTVEASTATAGPLPGVNAAGANASGANASGANASGVGNGAEPTPAVPAGLPTGIEDLAPYVKQSSCNPVDQPGAVLLGRLLQTTYPGTSYSIGRACGADGFASEHYEGRAVDWFVSVRDPAQAARAQAVLGWLLADDAAGHHDANARRLGVMYVIWDDRIWGAYSPDAGWRPYHGCATRPDRAWDTTCHRDHIHLSLSWAGARGRTSFWTGQVAPTDYGPCRPADLNWAPAYRAPRMEPCPSHPTLSAPADSPAALAALVRFGGADLGTGSSGPAVRAVQQGLGLGVDSWYGPVTAAAVTTFQTGHRLPATGRTDAETWRALIAASTAGPARVPSGPGPSVPPAPGPAPGPTAGPTPGTSAGPGVGAALRFGARGPAVLALQQAIGVSPASGWFGPRTWAAVAAVQRAHGLPVTGVVDRATWQAVSGPGRSATGATFSPAPVAR